MTQEQPEPRWWQRLIQIIPASRVGAWIFAQMLHHIDRPLLRATGGRVSLAEMTAGIPVVRLTTTGAKTGKERTVPVGGLKDGEKWVLIASNWGSESHPSWYYNLRANPEVKLTRKGRTNEYVAREATGEEREHYLQQIKEVYRGVEPYERRSGDRKIPIIVLTPKED